MKKYVALPLLAVESTIVLVGALMIVPDVINLE